MNPVATAKQRRNTLRAIDHAEARMLPPGWDAGHEHQFGATLTDTRGTAPLLIDVAEPDTDESDPINLAQQRAQQYPKRTTRRDQFSGLAKWLLAAGICAGLALIWASSL